MWKISLGLFFTIIDFYLMLICNKKSAPLRMRFLNYGKNVNYFPSLSFLYPSYLSFANCSVLAKSSLASFIIYSTWSPFGKGKSQKPYVMHNLIGKILVVVVDDSGEFILNPNNDEFCQSLIYLFTF